MTPATARTGQGGQPGDPLVSFELRLPPGQWRRLVTLADDTNLPIQVLILAALQAELNRRDPE